MVADAEVGVKGTLSRVFNAVGGFLKHMLSPTMIIMMLVMALPVVNVAAAGLGSGVTFGDIGLATLDMYGQMIAAPFTDGGALLDATGNALQGNISPNGYEWGMMDHGPHTATHGAVEVLSQELASRSVWFENLPEATQKQMIEDAEYFGQSIEEYTEGHRLGDGFVPEKW